MIFVFGDRRAQIIVHAEEIQNEIAPVMHIHISVPAPGDEREEDETGNKMHAEHFLQIFFGEKKEETGQPRQQNSDGSLRKRGESGEKIAEPIIFPIFRVAEIKGGDGDAHEKEKCGVGDDGLGQIPKFERGAEKKRGAKPDGAIIGARGEPKREKHGGRPEKSGGKTRGKFREAEERKRDEQLPIKKYRLVVPKISVNARRHPIAGRQHLPSR